MIESVYFNIGMSNSFNSSSVVYANEVKKQVSEKSMTGLMYASDFGYAISGYTGKLIYSSANSQMVNNWLFGQSYEWTMTAYSSSCPVNVDYIGGLSNYRIAYHGYAVRPVLYLQSNVNKLSGDGSIASPYTLGM